MTKRAPSAAPKQQADKSWGFVFDAGPGPGPDGEWRDRRQIRRRGFRTRKEAQAALDKLRADAQAGTFVAPQRQTVAEWAGEWLESRRHQLAPLTWASYDRNLRLHVLPRLGGLQLQSLDGGHLNRLYAELLDGGRKRPGASAGLSPRTVRYCHTIVGRMLKDAVRLRRVQHNAAEQASPPSAKAAKPPEMKCWTADELARFLEATAEDRYGPVWSFLALSGARRGEALGLRWADLDLEAGSASIRQQVLPMPRETGRGRVGQVVTGTKTADARVIQLDASTVAMLKAHRRAQARERLAVGAGYVDHGLVFPAPDGRPVQPDLCTKAFDRRVRQLDVPVIRLHDLRHTWATLALEAGVDVAVVSKQLGHSSPTVTWNTYQHVRRATQADAVDRVAASVFRR